MAGLNSTTVWLPPCSYCGSTHPIHTDTITIVDNGPATWIAWECPRCPEAPYMPATTATLQLLAGTTATRTTIPNDAAALAAGQE